LVENNTFISNTQAGILACSFFEAGDISHAIVRGNEVTGGANGIGVMAASAGTLIENNTGRGCLYQGIYVCNGSNVTISDNVVSNSSSVMGTQMASNIVIQNNQLSESLYNALYIANSSNIAITANQITKSGAGISLSQNTTNAQVTNNNVSGNYGNGLVVEDQVYDTAIAQNFFERNGDGGIWVNGSDHTDLLVTNNTVNYNGVGKDWRVGIFVSNATNVRIENNQANYNIGAGIGGGGICKNVVITQNTASYNKDGINFNEAYNVIIDNNTCSGNTQGGIYEQYCGNLTFSHNSITTSPQGITLQWSNDTTTSYNNVTGTEFVNGIRVVQNLRDSIINNDITGARFGITLTQTNYTQVTGNNVAGSVAFCVGLEASTNNQIFNNNFAVQPNNQYGYVGRGVSKQRLGQRHHWQLLERLYRIRPKLGRHGRHPIHHKHSKRRQPSPSKRSKPVDPSAVSVAFCVCSAAGAYC
jgi:parallel beta-helix repeat protein